MRSGVLNQLLGMFHQPFSLTRNNDYNNLRVFAYSSQFFMFLVMFCAPRKTSPRTQKKVPRCRRHIHKEAKVLNLIHHAIASWPKFMPCVLPTAVGQLCAPQTRMIRAVAWLARAHQLGQPHQRVSSFQNLRNHPGFRNIACGSKVLGSLWWADALRANISPPESKITALPRAKKFCNLRSYPETTWHERDA